MADDLGGTAPGIDQPPAPAPAPVAQPPRDPLAAGGIPPELQDRMLENAEALTQRQQQYAEQEAAVKPPALPKLGKVGAPPQNDIRGDAMAWLGFATVLGGIAGAMTKRSSMNALAAFSGTLEGLQQGNQQKFENNFKTWEAQAKATQENNKAEMDGYRNILERQDLDHRQRADQLEMWATQNRNKFMIELARASKKDPALFAAAMDSIGVKTEKGNDAMSRILETRERAQEARANRLEEIKLQGQNAIEAARARAEARQPLESEESLASIARRKYEGDPTAGRYLTGENRTKFDEIFDRILNEEGHSQQDYIRNQQQYAGGLSGARAVGTRLANLETVQRSALAIAPAALAASREVSRAPILALAEAQQYLQTQAGDPKLKRFIGYNLQLAEAAARAQKPTGVLDVALQDRFFQFLNTAQNQQSYEAAVNTIVTGIARELKAAKAQQTGEPVVDIEEMLKTPQQSGGASANTGVPTTAASGSIVIQGGWRYQLQPDGSYKPLGRVQ